MKRRGDMMTSTSAMSAALILLGGCRADSSIPGVEGGPSETVQRVAWSVPGRANSSRPAYDGTSVFFLSDSSTVHAFDPKTGARRWTFATDHPPYFGPGSDNGGCAIAGPMVVCSERGLFAFNRQSGYPQWSYRPAVGLFPGFYGFIADGESVYASSASGYLHAIDATTGTPRWANPVAVNDTNTSVYSPQVTGDLVIAPYLQRIDIFRGGVVAVDRITGAVRWKTAIPRHADSSSGTRSVVVWNATVLASSTDGRIYALDRETGSILWHFPGVGQTPPGWHGETRPVGADTDRNLVVIGTTLYAGSISGWMIAYDLVGRRELWRTTATRSSASFRLVAAAERDAIYVCHLGGKLASFSVREPAVNWLFPRIAAESEQYLCWGEPATGGGMVFVSSPKGYHAFRK